MYEAKENTIKRIIKFLLQTGNNEKSVEEEHLNKIQ